MDIKVHQYKGWLISKDKINKPEEFKQQTKVVCEIYKNAQHLEEKGTHVLCVDEKTGIQAIEHLNLSLPIKPGQVEKCEQEYKRHGTSGLIASRNVATGEIIAPLIQPTRTEIDFVEHLKNVIEVDPKAEYILVMDQLNTHKSESLVNFVAEQCNINKETLGIKGKSGILKSTNTRAEFLKDETHRIRIIYTPKHSSWLNQIEIWFSILTRRLLNRRYSFKSAKMLEEKILQFIEYYNISMAKPFKWTYAGKLLQE
jgi:transposase